MSQSKLATLSVSHGGRRSRVLSIVLSCSLALAAPAAAASRVHVRLGPPQRISESAAVRSTPGYVWVPGYPVWRGNQYDWITGRWVRAQRTSARVGTGRWLLDRNGWSFWDSRSR
jgi:hypothetical protein